jgi:MSHA pilin protein MshC
MAGGNGTPARARLRGAFSGFTIVELVATIAILAILAAFAVPRFTGNTAFAQRGYADELASSLRLARSIAVASSCDVRVSINAGTYQALQRAAGNPCATGGAFVTNVRRTNGTNLAGSPPNGVVIPGNLAFTFTGGTGAVLGGAPPATVIGPFTISVDADGWVQVQ